MPHPIVIEARRWLGTRFRHQGRRRASAHDPGGVDCLGLLIGVAEALTLQDRHGALLSRADEVSYGHLPDGARLAERLGELLLPVERMREGDILLFRLDGNPQHLAIVSDYGIIHAYAPARRVVEHRLDAAWEEKIAGIFRVP